MAWVTIRVLFPAAAVTGADAPVTELAEPAWRQVLRIGFGLLWVFDGILQAQPKMAVGLPSQVIEPTAASSPPWVQQVVNWAGTNWSYHPMQAGAASVWILGVRHLAAGRGARPAVPAGRAGQRRLGPGGVGVRRVLRRHLRPGPDLAVRRAGRGVVYAVARALIALPERAWYSPWLGRLTTAGTGAFLIGMAVLQAWPGRGFWQGTAQGSPARWPA